jgi:hypothetical protein
MIDWQQATAHISALGIAADDRLLIALFPPKDRQGKAGCTYIEVSAGSQLEPEQVERQLASQPGFSLGFIQNPGGTKDREIAWCRSLFFEDDSDESTMEEKEVQWEAAGLPRPSLQVWTGGKSVHHYWLLEEPCTPTQFRQAQKRLFRHVQASLPEADIDNALCNPARILRLAGGVHPSTGEMSRLVSAGGQRYSFEQLWNLTGEDGFTAAPSNSTLEAVRAFTGTAAPAAPAVEHQAPPAADHQRNALPDYDTPEHKTFRVLQVENDQIHNPTIPSFREYSRTNQLQLVIDALRFCPSRGRPGSNTYEAAFKLLASVVNAYGVNDALECAHRASWSQEHWDIVEEAQKIEENSTDRGEMSRVTIFHLFDTAEFNGWVRPWKITKSRAADVEDEEDAAENRLLRKQRVAEWIEARASQFTLADALHPAVAALLSERAQAFPVAEIAMLPPFLAAAASVLGTRYQVEVKKGWTEPMVFWLGSVGAASTLKTPVAQQCLKPLLNQDRNDQRVYKQQMQEWKAQSKDEKGAMPSLPRKRVAGDATLEGLCAALDNDATPGIVSYHDELVTFISSLDAYRGRSGPSKDRGHWLSMWSGQEINILRKGHDPIFIPETAVSLFGAVQQDKLQELLHGEDAAAKSGDGFWARFLWCVPCNPFPKMNLDESDIGMELEEIYGALDRITGQVTVKLSPEAWEVFAAQADRWSAEADRTYAARSAFLGKMRGYSVRFAGFLHALDYAMRIKDPGVGGTMNNIEKVISAETMQRALTLAQFFINQFDVLAPQVGGNEDLPSWVVKIVELAQSREDRKVTARDLKLKKWGDGPKERKGMLESLVKQYGIGTMLEAPRINQTWWQLT